MDQTSSAPELAGRGLNVEYQFGAGLGAPCDENRRRSAAAVSILTDAGGQNLLLALVREADQPGELIDRIAVPDVEVIAVLPGTIIATINALGDSREDAQRT